MTTEEMKGPKLAVRIDVRNGRAYAMNANGITTNDPKRAAVTRDWAKVQRLANALSDKRPKIVYVP